MDPISAVAVGPEGLIAFGTRFLPGSDTIETVAAASRDGLNFEPVALPEGLDIVVESVTFGEQGFVAAGAADDATPSGARPSILVSATGQEWDEVDLGDSLAGAVLQQIRATPAGYVLIGARPSEADRQRDDAFSWVSEDGREWLREAPLGGGAYRLFNGLASGPGGAVAVALDYEDDPGDGPLSTIRVWFAAQPLLVPR